MWRLSQKPSCIFICYQHLLFYGQTSILIINLGDEIIRVLKPTDYGIDLYTNRGPWIMERGKENNRLGSCQS